MLSAAKRKIKKISLRDRRNEIFKWEKVRSVLNRGPFSCMPDRRASADVERISICCYCLLFFLSSERPSVSTVTGCPIFLYPVGGGGASSSGRETIKTGSQTWFCHQLNMKDLLQRYVERRFITKTMLQPLWNCGLSAVMWLVEGWGEVGNSIFRWMKIPSLLTCMKMPIGRISVYLVTVLGTSMCRRDILMLMQAVSEICTCAKQRRGNADQNEGPTQ